MGLLKSLIKAVGPKKKVQNVEEKEVAQEVVKTVEAPVIKTVMQESKIVETTTAQELEKKLEFIEAKTEGGNTTLSNQMNSNIIALEDSNLKANGVVYVKFETPEGINQVLEGERVEFNIVFYNKNSEKVYMDEDVSMNISYGYTSASSDDIVEIKNVIIPKGSSGSKFYIDAVSDGIFENDEIFSIKLGTFETKAENEIIVLKKEFEITVKDDGKINEFGSKIVILEDNEYVIGLSNFGNIISSIDVIKITELPKNGKLYLNEVELSSNTEISKDDIVNGKLKFVPTVNSDEDGSFKYEVKIAGEYSSEATTEIEVIAVADKPNATISIEQLGTEPIFKQDNNGNSNNNNNNNNDNDSNIDYKNQYSYNSLTCGIKFTDTILRPTNDQVVVKGKMEHYTMNLGAGDNNLDVGNNVNLSSIHTYSGDDKVIIGNDVNNTTINLGGGTNSLNVGKNVDWSNLFGGSGDDSLEVKGSIDHTTVNLGNGNNKLDVGGELDLSTVHTGSSNDVVNIARDVKSSTINLGSGKNSINVGEDVSKSNIFTLQGNDKVNVDGTIKNSVVNLGLGDNSLTVGKEFQKSSIHTYSGADKITIKGNASEALINLGEGKNSLDIQESLNKGTILTGANQDAISIEKDISHTTIHTGAGNDKIFIGGNAHSTIVDGGSGQDTLFLPKDMSNYLFMDGVICKKPVSWEEFLSKNSGKYGLSCHTFTIYELDVNGVKTGSELTIRNIENVEFNAKAQDVIDRNENNNDSNQNGGSTSTDLEYYNVYKVSISGALKDLDGSESLTIKIDGVPSDAIITNGTYSLEKNSDGSYSFIIPAGAKNIDDEIILKSIQNIDDMNLRLTARATEKNDNDNGLNYAESEAYLDGNAQLSNATIKILEDTKHTLSMDDFGKVQNITTLTIVTLPKNGELHLNGVLVTEDTEISIDDINSEKLVFIPSLNSDLDSGFVFNANEEKYYTRIDITAVADAPEASIKVSKLGKTVDITEEDSTKYIVKSYDKLVCRIISTDPLFKKTDDKVIINKNMESSTLNLGEGKNALEIGGAVTLGNIYSGKENDKVSIVNTVKSTTINLGFGDNTLDIGKDLHLSTVHTYAGDDSVKIGNNLTNTTINLGDGENTLDVKNSVDWANIFTTSGDDKLNIGGNIEHTTVNLGAGDNEVVIGKTMDLSTLHTLGGDDNVVIKDSLERSTVNLGNGENSILIEQNLKSSTVITGSGDDLILVDGKIKDSAIYAGGGNDKIFINGAEKYTLIDGGSGHDVLYLSGSKENYRFEEGIICKKPITWEDFVSKNKNMNGLNCKIFTIYEVDAFGNRTGNKFEVRNIEDVVFDAKISDFVEPSGNEFMVDISAALKDTDGSESLTIKINGIPAGSSIVGNSYEIIENKDGSWDVIIPKGTTSIMDSVILKTPENINNIDLEISATATETRDNQNGENFKTTKSSFSLDIENDEIISTQKLMGDDIDLSKVIVKTTNVVSLENSSNTDKLKVDLQDILDLNSKQLVIKGDIGDTVELDKKDWQENGKTNVDGKEYNVYSHSSISSTVKLLIEDEIDIHNI